MHEDVEDFIKTWEDQIAKIEKRPIDSRGTYLIFLDFKINRTLLNLTSTEKDYEQTWAQLNNLESKLRVAIETSRCLYCLQNRSVWARIAESIAVMTYNKLPK